MFNLDEMPLRLARFLAFAEPGAGDVEVLSYTPMSGGYSRLLARADVAWTLQGQRVTESFVLRGDPRPENAPFETDRAAEWDVLRSIAEFVATAAARYIDIDGSWLDTPAIVLEHSSARSLLPILGEGADPMPLVPALAAAAASFHTIPLDRLPRGLPRPTSYDDYLDDRIDEWRRAAADHVEPIPVMNYVAGWLHANRPPPVPLSLTHGDFQTSNLMLDDTGAIVVLDWEMAQIGDPREDLGYFQAVARAAGPDLIGLDPLGFCARYRELTGFDESQVNPEVLTYFLVLGVIGIVRRVLEGGSRYARGTNRLLIPAFLLGTISFAAASWPPVCDTSVAPPEPTPTLP